MMTREEIIREFSKIYYDEQHRSPILNNTKWLGYNVVKCPLDLWVYQEIMFETMPDVIVETGSLHGGSGLWFANMLDLLHGRTGIIDRPAVISIDISQNEKRPGHMLLDFIVGSSISPDIISYVKRRCLDKKVMVVLDSDHRANHVYQELDIYSSFVSPGCYLIVEDTNVNGHPVLEGWGAGPMEALKAWLPKHPDFEIDKSREKFLCTMNPDGFLKRLK